MKDAPFENSGDGGGKALGVVAIVAVRWAALVVKARVGRDQQASKKERQKARVGWPTMSRFRWQPAV